MMTALTTMSTTVRRVSNADQLNTDGDAPGNACDADDDNDGVSDDAESAAGSNPLNAASTPETSVTAPTTTSTGTSTRVPDTDGDALNNCVDPDDDNDGTSDTPRSRPAAIR